MSYTPTTWKDGDIITAEKLNKIENGIAGDVVWVEITVAPEGESGTRLQSSYGEIEEALLAGKAVYCRGTNVYLDNNIEYRMPFVAAVAGALHNTANGVSKPYMISTVLWDYESWTTMNFEAASASETPMKSVGS